MGKYWLRSSTPANNSADRDNSNKPTPRTIRSSPTDNPIKHGTKIPVGRQSPSVFQRTTSRQMSPCPSSSSTSSTSGLLVSPIPSSSSSSSSRGLPGSPVPSSFHHTELQSGGNSPISCPTSKRPLPPYIISTLETGSLEMTPVRISRFSPPSNRYHPEFPIPQISSEVVYIPDPPSSPPGGGNTSPGSRTAASWSPSHSP